VAALTLLAACGRTAAPPAGPQEGQQPTGAAGPITLRLATELRPGSPSEQFVEAFAQKVNERANGRVKVEVYPGDQLVKAAQYPDALPAGTIEMALADFSKGWPAIIPEISVLQLPVFTDVGHELRALEGSLGERLGKLLEEKANTKVLAWTTTGMPDAMGCTKRLIRKPEDLRGLRLRVAGDLDLAQARALGGSGAQIAPTEMYMAMQRGTVDGVFLTTAEGVLALKLHEVAKYWTRVPVGLLASPIKHGFAINLAAWSQLPEDVQKVLADTAQETASAMIEELIAQANRQWEQIAQQPGVQVYQVPQGDLTQWKERLEPTNTEYLEKAVPKAVAQELLDMIAAAK